MIRDVTLGQGFEDVFAQYGAILSRVANSYEANEAMQQELLQEIAIAVWQGLSRFKGDSSVKTYILKIAHNRAVTHVANQVKRLDTHQYDHDDWALTGSRVLPTHQRKCLVNTSHWNAYFARYGHFHCSQDKC